MRNHLDWWKSVFFFVYFNRSDPDCTRCGFGSFFPVHFSRFFWSFQKAGTSFCQIARPFHFPTFLLNCAFIILTGTPVFPFPSFFVEQDTFFLAGRPDPMLDRFTNFLLKWALYVTQYTDDSMHRFPNFLLNCPISTYTSAYRQSGSWDRLVHKLFIEQDTFFQKCLKACIDLK